MDAMKLEGLPRETGKRATRSARNAGMVPCILYGHRNEPVAFQVPVQALNPLIYTEETHVVRVEVEGESWDAIMKQADFDPVTDVVRHADFQVLTAGEAITITVPVQFLGTPVGQTEGGDTQVVLHDVTLRCLPKDIPSHIEVDIAQLAIGDAIHVRDLEVEGVEFITPPQQTLVTVVPPRLEALATDEEELEVGEGGEVDTAEAPAGGEDADTSGDL